MRLNPQRLANRWLRSASVEVPDPYRMTREEFLAGTPDPKPKPGYQLLYHVTNNAAIEGISKHGLLVAHSKSPPKGTIWASTKPDEFYGGGAGAMVIFQVPKRGSPADADFRNGVTWDVGASVLVARDVLPKDIVAIDPFLATGVGGGRLSHFRNSPYAAEYWDQWFDPVNR